MAGEWRVTLIIEGRPGAKAGLRHKHVIDQLRSRLGDGAKISADKNQIFVYATAPEAAEEADQVARNVLDEQNLSASVRLEYWDSAAGGWRDPDATRQEAEPPDERRAGRTGLLDGVLLEVIADIIPP